MIKTKVLILEPGSLIHNNDVCLNSVVSPKLPDWHWKNSLQQQKRQSCHVVSTKPHQHQKHSTTSENLKILFVFCCFLKKKFHICSLQLCYCIIFFLHYLDNLKIVCLKWTAADCRGIGFALANVVKWCIWMAKFKKDFSFSCLVFLHVLKTFRLTSYIFAI